MAAKPIERKVFLCISFIITVCLNSLGKCHIYVFFDIYLPLLIDSEILCFKNDCIANKNIIYFIAILFYMSQNTAAVS